MPRKIPRLLKLLRLKVANAVAILASKCVTDQSLVWLDFGLFIEENADKNKGYDF